MSRLSNWQKEFGEWTETVITGFNFGASQMIQKICQFYPINLSYYIMAIYMRILLCTCNMFCINIIKNNFAMLVDLLIYD